ncbi:hypothetical protein PIB30_056246 [Stylosanthes scabra]|uniref:Uncharacterized protein n=1 Tax=Stylosanthes scabra TaxID=79078 RepID=A0ABU6VLR0_9FABA|nr:hypothetical protein [Stylosanthes scabra]
MIGVPLDLGEAEAETSTPPPTSTPVVPTPSLLEGFPAMRMIPKPGSRVQSSETASAPLEEELARQAGRVYLRWDGGNCWNKVHKGTTKISWVFENYYKWFVPQFGMAPDHAVRFWWDRWRAFFRL